MKILVLTGPMHPDMGNNANLIHKVALFGEELCDNEFRVLSCAFNEKCLPISVFGLPVYWITEKKTSLKDKLIARLVDKNGFSDYIVAVQIARAAKKIKKHYNYDAIIATCEPFTSAIAATMINGVKRVLYLMDPPEAVSERESTAYRISKLKDLLKKNDKIVTTPFIRDALDANGYNADKISTVGFPMICDNNISDTDKIKFSPDKINLLFCGWLYGDIRSPKYFLKLVERLDERFCVYFMGKECDQLFKRFNLNTKAEVVTLPQQPYDVALSAMAQADILINIGNSVPVHMPSKTLEYINTGKPFVNFYKMEDCPTLYYTNRYPLCLNLYEGDEDIDGAFEKFSEFCINKQGNTIPRETIKEKFSDCTPEFIAGKILEGLGI